MSKVYCGIGTVPKGYRRGTMKECAESGQIRYYGLKKVDPKMIELMQSVKKMPTRETLLKKATVIRVKYGKIKKEYGKNPDVKLKQQMDKYKKEYEKIAKLLKLVETKQKTQKGSSKKSSKKTSKKVSKKTSNISK